ncbi:SHOCT domain-containing protein [Ideonella sp. BN130291]|uniref:SHOCT domain-containing protein n=1 Tax=Ideonella sp. BN130291 TaxID=3112940 RepID=UPI002E257D4A|nr:SHOCT domain-containing protein [Ideonella sp. BN130291]
MKHHLPLALAVCLTLNACATADIVPMGTDVYMISQTSAGGVFTNMGTLKAEVIQRANSFAESKGKVAVPVAARETPPAPGRMPNYEYQFRLVDRNDPRASGGGLIKTPDMVIENRNQAPAVIVNPPPKEVAQPKDVYTELLKLDDLRKRGIITDAEFEAQKRKLLQGQ